jgi:hypothetical protein
MLKMDTWCDCYNSDVKAAPRRRGNDCSIYDNIITPLVDENQGARGLSSLRDFFKRVLGGGRFGDVAGGVGTGLQKSQEEAAFDSVIDIFRQAAGGEECSSRPKFGDNYSDNIAAGIKEGAAGVAGLYRQADLEPLRVIVDAG